MYKILLTFLGITLSSSLAADHEGLTRLMQGNERYVHDMLEHPNRTPERREALTSKQEPFAAIVGCSDSRVSPEILFDQGVGDLFVVRVAGNVVGPVELDSIEYSVVYLHASVVLVLGHANCGAVQAVMAGTTADIESVAALIEPALQGAHSLEEAIKANAVHVRDYLLSTPVIQRYVNEGKIDVRAAYYHLDTGVVELLD